MLIRLTLLVGVPLYLLAYIVIRLIAPVPSWILIPISLGVTAVVVGILWLVIGTAAGAAGHLMMPSTQMRGSDYSEQEALVLQGRIPEALASFDRHIGAHPEDLDARLRRAALLAGAGADVGAAEQAFLEVRALNCSERQERIVGNALIDLYRAADRSVELKAELARYARLNDGTRAGADARRYLRRLVRDASDPGLSE